MLTFLLILYMQAAVGTFLALRWQNHKTKDRVPFLLIVLLTAMWPFTLAFEIVCLGEIDDTN